MSNSVSYAGSGVTWAGNHRQLTSRDGHLPATSSARPPTPSCAASPCSSSSAPSPNTTITALRAQAIATGVHWPDIYALSE
jgi:hypothetical protein